MNSNNRCIEVRRDDYRATRVIEEKPEALQAGNVRLRVDRFALTANNVTYALAGDMLGYWDFFPTEAGWGRIPCMGWGEIVESAHAELPVGGRYYGWFPMARTVDMTASAIAQGLRDDGPHRAAHAAPYRTYVASDRDPFYQTGSDGEARQALLRALFITGYLADDFFGESDYHGAKAAIVISASSKTGIAFATTAQKRPGLEVVGVTSAGNVAFCNSLGCYDRVLRYDELDQLNAASDAVVIDMAGNAAALTTIHQKLGAALKYSMMIGMSHHDSDRSTPPDTGPAPELFFAPSQMEKRMADWGPDGYAERLRKAVLEFSGNSRQWLDIQEFQGSAGATAAWENLINGEVPPNIGQIVGLN